MRDSERKAKIAAYEEAYLARLENEVIRCQAALRQAERRLSKAIEQHSAGELMTAALDPSAVRVLGLVPAFPEAEAEGRDVE